MTNEDSFERHYSSSKTRCIRRRHSRVERQKQLRYEALNCRRFLNTSYCLDDSDSDSTDEFAIEPTGRGHRSPTDIIKALLVCQPLIEFQYYIKTSVNDILAIITDIEPQFGSNDENIGLFFDDFFVAKMSSFLGSPIRRSLQIKIMKMFDQLIQTQECLAEEMIESIRRSQLIPKLIYLIESGTEKVVKQTLTLLRDIIIGSELNPLITHIIDCGLIETMTKRVQTLNWKSRQRFSMTPKLHQILNEKCLLRNGLTFTTQQLLQNISSAVEYVVFNYPNDGLRVDTLLPLLRKLLSCPDIQVQNNCVNALSGLNRNQSIETYVYIIENFCQKMFSFINGNQKSVILSTIQLFYQIFESNPQLIAYKDMKHRLTDYLAQVLSHNNDYRVVRVVLDFVANVGPLVLKTDPTIDGRVIYQKFLHLFLFVAQNNSFSAENRKQAFNEWTIKSTFI